MSWLARKGISLHLDTGYENSSTRLEMMPLMDVIFLLLVFFIYAMVTMSVHHGIGVSLPKAVSETLTGHHAVITLSADGSTWLEGQQIEADALVPRVAAECYGMPILISADESVPIGRGLSLLSEMREVGITEVAFQTLSTPKGKIQAMPDDELLK